MSAAEVASQLPPSYINPAYHWQPAALIVARVTSDDLTIQQAQALLDRVGPMLAYLHELRSHIDYRRFSNDDRLRTFTDDAYNAVHALSVELHYLTCKKVGRRR